MDLLTTLKIVSELITAASGCFGLFSDFKDKQNRVTRNGKIALIGIIVGFVVSVGISVNEHVEAERASRRALRPLGHFHVRLFVLSPFASTPWGTKFRDYLVHAQGKILFPSFKDLPPGLAKDPEAKKIQGPTYEFAIYRAASGVTCNKISGTPDLYLERTDQRSLEDNPSVHFKYLPTDDKLELWVDYDLQVSSSSQELFSTEDLPNAVMWIRSRQVYEPWELNGVVLTMANGVSFQPSPLNPFPPGAQLTDMGIHYPMSKQDVCYTFPSNGIKTALSKVP